MKKYLLIVMSIASCLFGYSEAAFSKPTYSDPGTDISKTVISEMNSSYTSKFLSVRNINSSAKTTVIDQLDSVVFDYSQAVVTGDTIEFPISILSDDTVYALDFSFKYDHSELLFDTIVNITPNLQSLYYYNTNDSTLRFTSNTLTYCTNDTVLVLVRFTMLNGQFNPAFINTIKGYLNGNVCSIKTPNYSAVGFDELESQTEISVYPNPAQEFINVESSVAVAIQLFNVNGQLILEEPDFVKQHKISTRNLSKGTYFLKIANAKSVSTRKVVVN